MPFRIMVCGINGHFTRKGALKNDSCTNEWKKACPFSFFLLLSDLASTNSDRSIFSFSFLEKKTLKIYLASSLHTALGV